MKYQIENIKDGTIAVYINDLGSIENIITEYLICNSQSSQIHNKKIREDIKRKVTVGKHSLSIGDLICRK